MPERGGAPARRSAIKIPGYTLEAEIGRGGMGIVYRARQESIGRVVAVKILPRSAAKNQPFVEKFLREAKAAARLNHENVVTAIDAGRAGDIVYFVMELVDGETVRDVLDREGPLPVARTVRILRDVAAALVHAERHGLVHRDVKPDNIMLNADGRAQLCDLGLARLAPQEGDGLAGVRTRVAEGTPYYIAPEQARGFADIDIRADLYALGATAYHLLTGEYAFDGEDAREIMWKQVNRPFPDVTEKRKDLPRSLVALIGRLVEKEREKRPQRPAEVVAALDAILAEIGAGPAAATPPGGASVAGAAGAAGPRRRTVAIAACLALAAALSAGAIMIATSPSDGAASSEADPSVVARDGDREDRERPPDRRLAPPAPAPAPGAGPALAPARADEGAPADAPAQSSQAREADAALKLKILRTSLGDRPDPKEAIERYRALALEYPGTRAAAEADAEARALEARLASATEKKLADLAGPASELMGKGEFVRAAGLYSALLAQEKGGPGEAKVCEVLAQIDRLCEERLSRVEAEARAAAAKGDFAAAQKLCDDFLARATEAVKARAQKLRESLAASANTAEAAKEAKAVADDVRALVRAGKHADALAKLDAAAKDPRFAQYRAGIESMRATVDAVKKATDAIAEKLGALAGQEAEVPLVAGDSVFGKVQEFDRKDLALVVKEQGAKEPVRLELREIAAPFLGAKIATEASYDAKLGAGLALLYAGAVEAAAKELEAAGKLRPLPEQVKQELGAAEHALPERLAEASLARAAALAERGKHDKALACAERLRTGELKDTAFARSHQSELAAAWKKARAGQLADAQPQQLFCGKVTGKRGGKITVHYLFASPAEVQDWVADTASEDFASSKITPLNGACEVTGRVVWRGAVKGDIHVEAVVRSQGGTLAYNWTISNANIVVYDKGAPWTGWMVGIGCSPTGSNAGTTFNLSRSAPKTPGALFECPSHMVGRLDGAFTRSEWLWAARGPAVPGSEPYKIEIAARSKKLAASFVKTSVLVPIPAEDMRGGVAIVPFTSKITVEELKISGELDEEWLARNALLRAEQEFGRPPEK